MNIITFLLLYLFVFATGSSGLIFQVTWQKYLSRLLGSDSIATAIILATFLGGLSFGYYLCGKFSVRVKNHFKAYALLEGTIGLWCLLFPSIFAAIDALTRSWRFTPPVLIILQGIFCSALLMGIPTICMGGTLPFLTRGISRNVGEATRIHANVYAINTAGAFIGTLIGGFYLIPQYGLPLTIMGASFVNFAAGFFFYSLSTLVTPTTAEEVSDTGRIEAVSAPSLDASSRIPARLLYSIAFLSGFYVMTLENVFIRLVNLSIGSSSYSFSLIVAVFIFAIAVGSSVVGLLHRIPRKLLFFNQLLITLCLLGIYLSLDNWPYWAHVIRIAFQSNMLGFWGYYGAVFLALAAVLVLPVACMGATIPLVFHELKRDLVNVGKHSGLLFSWNTAGNLAGSLIGGIVFYYVMNNPHVFLTMAFLAACSAVLVGWTVSKKYALPTFALALGILIATFFTPFYQQEHFMVGTFRMREPIDISLSGPRAFFEQFNQGRILKFYEDDPTCAVAAVEFSNITLFNQHPLSIFVNGKSDSDTIRDMYTLKLSAHIPALFAKTKKQVMVIGLGTGVTAGELTLYPDIEQIDIAEISPAVVTALPYFQEFTHNVHQDPRVRIHIGDAFRILGRSDQKWDIIISEPSNPWTTGVDLLFTEEYYKLINAHLTEDGILVQWTQLYDTNPAILGMILNTVQQEFTQARAFRANPGDLLIIASNRRLSSEDLVRAETILETNQSVRASLKPLNVESLDSILIREVWPPAYLADHFQGFGLQTMDNPRLHYLAGKGFFLGNRIAAEYLLNPSTLLYLPEFLLSQKYPNWASFDLPKDALTLLLNSARDNLSGGVFPMFASLRLRAFLSDSTTFPFSEDERATFQITLLPFVTNPSPPEEEWSKIGLADASWREKAEPLVAHVRQFRNWIVPYPVEGLKALLQAGMISGNDASERNWCTLQMLKLLLEERVADEKVVQTLLSQITRDPTGNIILQPQDQSLLNELDRLIKRRER